MTHKRYIFVFFIVVAVLFIFFKNDVFAPGRAELTKNNLIRVESPKPDEVIKSPLAIMGEARGNWFFEASFPVVLTDWDGKIIAEHYATALDDWMTTEFVPFKAELQFENPSFDADFSKRGTLILKKDNPSGLPEYDDAIEIPVRFK